MLISGQNEPFVQCTYVYAFFFSSSIQFCSCERKINSLLNKARERPNYTDYLNCGRQCQYGSPITNDYTANKLTIPKRDRLTRIKLAKNPHHYKNKNCLIDYSFNYFQLRFVKGGKNRVAFRFVSNSPDSNLNEKRRKKMHNTTREAFRFNH